jgi:hypothetical protein
MLMLFAEMAASAGGEQNLDCKCKPRAAVAHQHHMQLNMNCDLHKTKLSPYRVSAVCQVVWCCCIRHACTSSNRCSSCSSTHSCCYIVQAHIPPCRYSRHNALPIRVAAVATSLLAHGFEARYCTVVTASAHADMSQFSRRCRCHNGESSCSSRSS